MMTTTLLPGTRLGGLNKWARTLALGLAAALGAAPFGVKAQLVLDSATPKTETFDAIGTSATAAAPTGFKFSAEAAPTYNSANNYTATTAAASGNNFTAGGTYNFGAGTGSSDRALGFLTSSSYVTPRHILLAVSNASGRTVQDLSVQFNLEKYRSGSREFNWTFWTSADGVNWTAQAAGAQNYPADANNTVYSYPPLATAKTVALAGINLANGATYYLRWTQQGTGGSTNGQAAGLDDVTLTPTLGGTTTPTPAPTPTVATGSVSPTSFCVTSTSGSAAFDVPFTTTGTLGGTYSVQLSDASGAFANTTSNLIGSGSSSPVSAVIPAGTTSGTAYRVRVLNSSPATVGTDNGADLTISLTAATNPVTVTPSGAQSVTTTGTGATLTATATLSNSTFAWQYGTSAGGPYTSLIAGATGSTYQLKGTDFAGAGTYYVVAQATATTTCGSVAGTSAPLTVTVTAPAATPTLTVSDASLADFGSVVAGAASSLKDFTVEGTGLSGNLTITPPAGFEVRLAGGAFACCPIVLTPTDGTLSLTAIEVRFVPTAAQAYAANITVEGSGQPTQAVAVSGTGLGATYPATLSTVTVTGITGATATSGGTVASDGGSAVTARGVVWGRATNPTVLLTTKTTDGSGAGTFASTITGLVPGTTYYVRAYATNSVGTTYGEELTFTTTAVPLAAEPTSQATLAQGTLGSTSMQLLLGGGPSQKRLVLARLGSAVDATPTDATTYTADAAFGAGQAIATGTYVVYNGTGSEVTVTGLRPGSPYYFTVFAFNDDNTPYAENYLTTTPGTLTVNTPGAPAALLLEENFDYPAGSLLTATNWTAHSGAGSNSVAVVAANLGLAGYSANSGNAAALTGNGEDVNRQFAPALYARTPAYASFLVKVNSASTTADYFFHLGPQTIGTTFRARVFVRRTTSGKVQFGTSSGSGAVTYASTEYDLGSTNLLVVKYTFDEASNSSQLFINPSTDTEPATADATATETGTTPAAPNNNIGSVALRQGTNSPNLVFDGLRVGTTFGVVKTGLTCSAPTAVAVSQVATTTASVRFVASSTATGDYTITYTPSGGPAQTVTTSASPITLTGLTPNTTYAVTVSSQCTGGQTATTTAVSFTTLGLRAPENPSNTVAGLNYQYYEAAGSYTKLPDFASSTPLQTSTTTSFDVKSLRQRDYAYALRYTGYVTVPTDGLYTFYTNSDDGSQLLIGSTLVVDNDGEHGLQEQAGTIGLQAGTHAITITYFQSGGGENLLVSYEGPGLAKQALPTASLSRVSSPTLRVPENPSNTVAGLNYQYYEAAGSYTKLPDFASSTPLKAGAATNFNVQTLRQRDYAYALRYTGYVTVPTDGLYTFYTSSDDGSQLLIGSTLVVDNDGEHGLQEQAGTIGLQAGTHAITITYFQSGGGENLLVSYEGPGLAKQALPTASLSRMSASAARLASSSAPANASVASAELHLQAYPNPCTTEASLSFSLPTAGAYTLAVYDATGRLIETVPGSAAAAGEQQLTLHTELYQAGLYVVRLSTATGTYQLRLVKN